MFLFYPKVKSVALQNIRTDLVGSTSALPSYDAIVCTQLERVTARNARGEMIDSGKAGIDDDRVIQSALDNLIEGGILLIAAGRYILGTTLTINKARTIVTGQGESTIITPGIDTHAFIPEAPSITIEDLYVLHRTTGVGRGVYALNAVSGLTVRNCRFENCYHAIATVNNCNAVTIEKNFIVSCGRADGAILLANSSGKLAKKACIKCNTILTSANHGIQVYCSGKSGQNWEDVQVLDNIIDTPRAAGIFISNSVNVRISNNKVHSNGSEGIDWEYCSNVMVNNNEVRDSTLQAFSCFDLTSIGGGSNSDVTVTNNKSSQALTSTSKAIYMEAVGNLIVHGNTVETYADGIYLIGNQTNSVISDNILVKKSQVGNIGINIDLGKGKAGNNILIRSNKVEGFAIGISFGSGSISHVITDTNDLQHCTTLIHTTVKPSNWTRRIN